MQSPKSQRFLPDLQLLSSIYTRSLIDCCFLIEDIIENEFFVVSMNNFLSLYDAVFGAIMFQKQLT